MRKTLSQLTCLYQLWRVIWVSAMCTFLVSVALGRDASALDDMVRCVCVWEDGLEDENGKYAGESCFIWEGPLGANVGERRAGSANGYGEAGSRTNDLSGRKEEEENHKIPRPSKDEEAKWEQINCSKSLGVAWLLLPAMLGSPQRFVA